MKALTLSETVDRLLSIERPAVVTHVRPDGDTMGTARALMEVFRALGKEPVFLATEVPERLAFLLEGQTRVFDATGYDPVAVDVASPSQLGDLCKVLDGGRAVTLTIDHHAVGAPFSDAYIRPELSSAGEVLFLLVGELVRRGKLTLTEKIAYPLFAAISSDTGCFRFSNATADTHIAAAALIATGIDAADVNHRLFESKSPSLMAAEGLAASRATLLPGEGIAYALITADDRRSCGIAMPDLETAIDVVRSLAGATVAFVIRETDAGEYKVSLRSTGPDVARVAAKFGGGGHIRAAGCTVSAPTIEGARDLLLAAIREGGR